MRTLLILAFIICGAALGVGIALAVSNNQTHRLPNDAPNPTLDVNSRTRSVADPIFSWNPEAPIDNSLLEAAKPISALAKLMQRDPTSRLMLISDDRLSPLPSKAIPLSGSLKLQRISSRTDGDHKDSIANIYGNWKLFEPQRLEISNIRYGTDDQANHLTGPLTFRFENGVLVLDLEAEQIAAQLSTDLTNCARDIFGFSHYLPQLTSAKHLQTTPYAGAEYIWVIGADGLHLLLIDSTAVTNLSADQPSTHSDKPLQQYPKDFNNINEYHLKISANGEWVSAGHLIVQRGDTPVDRAVRIDLTFDQPNQGPAITQ